jgi:hypothetical protein
VRYRLDIVAPSIIEVVRCAGGWVFDRVMAGWDVTVLVADNSDDRPLQILGAETADLETALVSGLAGLTGPRPHALAVAADLYERDARVRQGVRNALESGQTEVTLWGDTWPAELDRVDSVEHRLSVAARAFKAQALAAASAPVERIAFTEMFRSGTPACCPVAADLVPAS